MICKNCGKEYVGLGNFFCGYVCSNKYRWKNSEYKEKMKKIQKGHLVNKKTKEKIRKKAIERFKDKTNHPLYGKHHTEESKRKMRKIREGKAYEEIYGKERAKEIRKKLSEKHKSIENRGRFKKGMVSYNRGKKCLWVTKRNLENNPSHNPKVRKKISIAKKGKKHSEETKKKMRERWKDLEYRKEILKKQTQNNKINKKEETIYVIIKRFSDDFLYTGNGKFWVSGTVRGILKSFNPDFIDKKRKLIIEFYGDYFHKKQKNKENDMLREEIYLKRGHKILIIWQSELEKDINGIINKIHSFISKPLIKQSRWIQKKLEES